MSGSSADQNCNMLAKHRSTIGYIQHFNHTNDWLTSQAMVASCQILGERRPEASRGFAKPTDQSWSRIFGGSSDG